MTRIFTQTHDTHHPVAIEEYYEDQKEEAIRKAKNHRANCLPKYLTHFQNVLENNPDGKEKGETYLIGSTTTTTDMVLFQVSV